MKWPLFPLDEVADVSGGSTPRRNRSEYWDGGGIPWVTPTDLPMPGTEIADVYDTADHITEEGLRSCAANMLPVGTVLYSSRATIGKIGIARVPLATNQGFANFTPKPGVKSEYLAFALQYFTAEISALAGSTTFKEVRRGALKKYKVPLPSPSEQQRISEILDQANALRKKRAEADVKAARILPAFFYKMFGDPATNPKGWRMRPLCDFEARVRYGLGQPPKASETGGVALIRATNISRGTISATNMICVDPQDVPPGKNAFLKEDEVIVVRSGAYTGDIAQVTKEWEGCIAGYDLVVTPGRYLTGEFVEAYLLTAFVQRVYFQNLKARAGQPHLNAAQVAATPFFDVPRELQMSFSEVVRSTRVLRKQREAVNGNLEKTFAVMLRQAFTGDLTARWREAHMKELLAEMEVLSMAIENRSRADRGLEPLQGERGEDLAQTDESVALQPLQEIRSRRGKHGR